MREQVIQTVEKEKLIVIVRGVDEQNIAEYKKQAWTGLG